MFEPVLLIGIIIFAMRVVIGFLSLDEVDKQSQSLINHDAGKRKPIKQKH